MRRHTITAELRRTADPAAWHFVTLPADVADEIHARAAGAHAPFGRLAVRATLGATTWETSIFRDTRRDSYVLPVKAAIRRRERVGDGDRVRVTLEVAV